MKLYIDPIATTCRPVTLFAADHGLKIEYEYIRLSAGEHLKDGFAAINPNRAVPVLVDGDFRLTECSAVLKYLADRFGSPTYPVDLRARAHVNQAMDWFNTGLYRDLGYGVVYAQALPGYRRENPLVHTENLRWSSEKAGNWLRILNDHMLSDNDYVCGSAITVADYLGVAYVTLADWVGFDFTPYPKVADWIARIRARPALAEAFAPHDKEACRMRTALRHEARSGTTWETEPAL